MEKDEFRYVTPQQAAITHHPKGFWGNLGRSFQVYNWVGQLATHGRPAGLLYDPVAGYRVTEDPQFKGDLDQMRAAIQAGSESPAESAELIRRYQVNRQIKQAIEIDNSWVAPLAAGILDPVNLIPIPSLLGAGVVRGAIRGGVGIGATGALSEGLRAQLDPTMTPGELAINMGAATVIGTGLGATLGRFTRKPRWGREIIARSGRAYDNAIQGGEEFVDETLQQTSTRAATGRRPPPAPETSPTAREAPEPDARPEPGAYPKPTVVEVADDYYSIGGVYHHLNEDGTITIKVNSENVRDHWEIEVSRAENQNKTPSQMLKEERDLSVPGPKTFEEYRDARVNYEFLNFVFKGEGSQWDEAMRMARDETLQQTSTRADVARAQAGGPPPISESPTQVAGRPGGDLRGLSDEEIEYNQYLKEQEEAFRREQPIEEKPTHADLIQTGNVAYSKPAIVDTSEWLGKHASRVTELPDGTTAVQVNKSALRKHWDEEYGDGGQDWARSMFETFNLRHSPPKTFDEFVEFAALQEWIYTSVMKMTGKRKKELSKRGGHVVYHERAAADAMRMVRGQETKFIKAKPRGYTAKSNHLNRLRADAETMEIEQQTLKQEIADLKRRRAAGEKMVKWTEGKELSGAEVDAALASQDSMTAGTKVTGQVRTPQMKQVEEPTANQKERAEYERLYEEESRLLDKKMTEEEELALINSPRYRALQNRLRELEKKVFGTDRVC